VKTDPRYSDLEKLLGRLMLAGVTLSAVCLAIGLVLYLGLADVSHATAVVTFGLIVLMLTPGLRVTVAVIEAVRMHDWFFVATTGAVIFLLGLTMTLALNRLG
jgi:uncharacterized membrane protein